jgi:crotonobetainyl-CoA hydratase
MSHVSAVVHGHVLVVTLDRPAARNAVNAEMAREVSGILERAENDDEIRVLIITGAGDRAFCAGADLKEAGSDPTGMLDEHTRRWGFAGYTNHPISKPTIAAVNGFALGGGTEIVLASDLAVMVEDAELGLPEVTRGIYAGSGGVFRMPAQIPLKVAMEAILTGRSISASRALALGLVNDVVARDDLMDAALTLAQEIAGHAPLAVQASKRIATGVVAGESTTELSAWALSDAEGQRLLATADAAEGLAAFAEKRPPVWRGN